jgi:phosphonate transport system substrate-binding protein
MRAIHVTVVLALTLTLAALAPLVPAYAAAPSLTGLDYVIQAGDTLSELAQKNLGQATSAPAILLATNARHLQDPGYAQLLDETSIRPGDKIFIPDAATVQRLTAPPAPGALGSADKPVQMYFVPSVQVQVIVEGGQDIAKYFLDKTGIHVDVRVPTSYSAVIEAMGAAEGDIMAFIPALAYVLSHQRYGVDAALSVVRQGRSWYTVQFIARRDSKINSLQDLSGKIWAYPDQGSTSGYMVPLTMFNRLGIKPGRELAAGGHTNAVIAVYDGSADFGTTYFSPPGGPSDWKWGDPPEPAGPVKVEQKDGAWTATAGGLPLRDARVAVLGTYQDVIDKVKIVALGDPIPNDTVSFVKDFDPVLRARLVDALLAYSDTPGGQKVLANPEFYDISGFEFVQDKAFDPVRDMVKAVGLDLEEKYGLKKK